MALNFPNNPTIGQTYQSGSSATYQFNSKGYWATVLPPTQVVNYPNVANWTTVGTIQSVGIGGWGSAPTVPTNPVRNAIAYKQLGPKTHKVRGAYQSAASPTGGANGSGDYLFQLPYGLQFDSTVPGQEFYTANSGVSAAENVLRGIPGSSAVIGAIGGASYTAGFPYNILPYNATYYRIQAGIVTNSTYCWQSGFFAIGTTGNLIAEWEFEFQSL